MPNNIDPLAYEEDLTKAGVPAGQIDQRLSELNTKIDRTKVELEARINDTKTELETRIAETKAALENKIHRAKVETIIWTAGIVISGFGLQGYVVVNLLK